MFAIKKKEKWKDVVGYEGLYRVSSKGRVIKIRKLYSSGDWNMSSLAKKFGVANTTIQSIINNKTWTHL